MTLIKKMEIGKTNIEIHSDYSEEEKRLNLIRAYDTINNIARKIRTNGINVDHWFYTKEELKELEEKGTHRFI